MRSMLLRLAAVIGVSIETTEKELIIRTLDGIGNASLNRSTLTALINDLTTIRNNLKD